VTDQYVEAAGRERFEEAVSLTVRRTTSDEVFASCDRQDEVLEWALGRTLERATLRLVAITAAACAVVAVLIVAISGR
jgi:hypothetical protein